MYMISIKEYFNMNKEFLKDSFDLNTHRSRVGFVFIHMAWKSNLLL